MTAVRNAHAQGRTPTPRSPRAGHLFDRDLDVAVERGQKCHDPARQSSGRARIFPWLGWRDVAAGSIPESGGPVGLAFGAAPLKGQHCLDGTPAFVLSLFSTSSRRTLLVRSFRTRRKLGRHRFKRDGPGRQISIVIFFCFTPRVTH